MFIKKLIDFWTVLDFSYHFTKFELVINNLFRLIFLRKQFFNEMISSNENVIILTMINWQLRLVFRRIIDSIMKRCTQGNVEEKNHKIFFQVLSEMRGKNLYYNPTRSLLVFCSKFHRNPNKMLAKFKNRPLKTLSKKFEIGTWKPLTPNPNIALKNRRPNLKSGSQTLTLKFKTLNPKFRCEIKIQNPKP